MSDFEAEVPGAAPGRAVGGPPGGDAPGLLIGVPGVGVLTPVIPIQIGIYTDRTPLGLILPGGSVLALNQGDQVNVWAQLSTIAGDLLLITAPPVWKVYDALGFGGIAAAVAVNSYDTVASQVVAAQIFLDTALLEPGDYTAQILIFVRDGSNPAATPARVLCEIGLTIVNSLT